MEIKGPKRIICLTEEPTEILYLLGEQHRIVGISRYTVRPEEAKKNLIEISEDLDFAHLLEVEKKIEEKVEGCLTRIWKRFKKRFSKKKDV